MRIGKRRARLTIERPVETKDNTGAVTSTAWPGVGKYWAYIEPLRGRESLQAHAIAAEMDTRINVRWSESLAAITTGWRGREGTTIYNFVSVAHVELRHREIEIMARSGQSEG